jgi:dihydroorotase/allantoinase
VLAELEAIQRLALFARATGCKAHVFHLSSKDGLESIQAWRKQGVDLTCETGPHYCFLELEEYERRGSAVRMNPPVRGLDHGAALLTGLVDGSVEQIATDHSPHTAEEKLNDDIWQATSGFVGVETSLQLFLSEAVNRGRMSLPQLVKVTSHNPARTWGMAPRKGRLQVGSDADLTIVDLGKEWLIDAKRLHSKNNVTPFDGWRGRGQAVATVVRGQVVMRDGELVGRPAGRMVGPGDRR